MSCCAGFESSPKDYDTEDFVKYQVLVAPKRKPGKTRKQELADRVKSLQRLRSQEATHKGHIDKLELDLLRHRDMLRGVLSRIRVESEECEELRLRLQGNKLRQKMKLFLIPSVILSREMTWLVKMLLRRCTLVLWKRRVGMSLCFIGSEDDLDVSRDNGIWERRRKATFKNKRMLKL